MALYKLCKVGVIRSDGAIIPATLANRDYKEYVAWLNAGGVPDPAEPGRQPDTDLQVATHQLQSDPVFRALVKVLATHFGLTPAQLVAEIKAQV
jgi:hypothetical protein